MRLRASIAAKGPRGFVERVVTIAARFGPTPAQMERRLREFGALAEQCGISPTFPITAVVVGRSSRTVRHLQAEGVEFAIHGLVHNDHLGMSGARQTESIAGARQVFARVGVEVKGFRAPYLRANADTLAAIRENGLEYDSSQAVAFQVLPPDVEAHNDGVRRALEFYRAQDARRTVCTPRIESGVVRIPVAIPDDEIMVDRLHLGPAQQTEAWTRILDDTYDRGELFTIQLHPERIGHCRVALATVLMDARTRPEPVWFANLGDVARWWRARATARIDVDQKDPDSTRVRLVGPPEVRLAVRTPGCPERTTDNRSLLLDRPPVVGISRLAPDSLAAFLVEEGYVVRVGAGPREVGAYVEVPGPDFDQVDVVNQLAAGPGPLVRVARWPRGCRSACAISGDIDALTLTDFFLRYGETRSTHRSGTPASPAAPDPRKVVGDPQSVNH